MQLREPTVAVGSVVTMAPAAKSDSPTDDGAAADPATALAALVAQDRAAADALLGQWVPQVSAKKVGTADDGTIYDEAAILAAVRTAKARYPQALLIRSDDYRSFRLGGFWVIVVATPYAGAEGANAWCESNGLSRDDCFAKRLSHTDGPQGSTVPRR